MAPGSRRHTSVAAVQRGLRLCLQRCRALCHWLCLQLYVWVPCLRSRGRPGRLLLNHEEMSDMREWSTDSQAFSVRSSENTVELCGCSGMRGGLRVRAAPSWGHSFRMSFDGPPTEKSQEEAPSGTKRKTLVDSLRSSIKSFVQGFFESDDETDSEEEELAMPPPKLQPAALNRKRRAVWTEARGWFNPQLASFEIPKYAKLPVQRQVLQSALDGNPFFHSLAETTIDALLGAMPIEIIEEGACLVRQGQAGDSMYVLLRGVVECYNDAAVDALPQPAAASTGSTLGQPHRPGQFVRRMGPGSTFGELAMLWSTPRTRTIYACEQCEVARLSRELYHEVVMRSEMHLREERETILRGVKLLETLNDEAISRLADVLEARTYLSEEQIIRQGSHGNEFFVVTSGICSATIATGNYWMGTQDIQEHRRYNVGDLFGERALLKRTVRAATVTAVTRVEVLCLSRSKFERMLGPLDQLQKVHYLADPRKSIADFYRAGDRRGPRGACGGKPHAGAAGRGRSQETSWFAVYRPTSRDAIAKMLNGEAVGKGLNVKGKSAKKNWLSGFVPFLQISDNDHKKYVEDSPKGARLHIFFTTAPARQEAIAALEQLMAENVWLDIADRRIHEVDELSGVFGIDVPEPLVREAFIMKPDLAPTVGWETGRVSEPAFMDMNLHAVRDGHDPQVVLFQMDQDRAMNPHGLLIAYSEASVKPVVSDFDTFTVGSRNMAYETLAQDQAELAAWSLDQTREILENPTSASWNSRWLGVLRKAQENGGLMACPKYGFGDSTSCRLIEGIIEHTKATGAVRHGAECFNFSFPQPLDEEYLVVWSGFDNPPWAYKDEPELRAFLLERIREGYTFPVNPVWPVRDRGWAEVLAALRTSEHAAKSLRAWYPESAGILERIDELRRLFPEGFQELPPVPGSRERLATGPGDLETSECMDWAMQVMKMRVMDRISKTMKGRLSVIRMNRLARLGSLSPRAEAGAHPYEQPMGPIGSLSMDRCSSLPMDRIGSLPMDRIGSLPIDRIGSLPVMAEDAEEHLESPTAHGSGARGMAETGASPLQ